MFLQNLLQGQQGQTLNADIGSLCQPDFLDHDLQLQEEGSFETNYVTQIKNMCNVLDKPIRDFLRAPQTNTQVYNRCRLLHTIRHMIEQQPESYTVMYTINKVAPTQKQHMYVIKCAIMSPYNGPNNETEDDNQHLDNVNIDNQGEDEDELQTTTCLAGIDTGATKTVLPEKCAKNINTTNVIIRTADGSHVAKLARKPIPLKIHDTIFHVTPLFFRDRALLGLDVLQHHISDWTMDRQGCYFCGNYLARAPLNSVCNYLTLTAEAAIPINDDTAPIRTYTPKLTPHQSTWLRQEIQRLTQQGTITKSKSHTVSPIVLVPKKDAYRLCINYKDLNKRIHIPYTILPNQEYIRNEVAKGNYVNVYDVKDAYHMIPIQAEDTHKTAFSTPFGTYEFLKMPFGLASAPFIFQTYLTQVLEEYKIKNGAIYETRARTSNTRASEFCRILAKT